MLALMAFGLAGSIVELLLLDHYEDASQFVPLVLIGVSLAVVLWHIVRPGATNVRALQILMSLFLVAGAVGIYLHFRGAEEFQLEIDPSQPRWELFKKAIRAKAPPVLAPGLMMQLGMLGLIYTYRHPALAGAPEATSREME
jgi:hypothetical protein